MAENIGFIKLPIDRLHMELTNHCNFSCEFCPNSVMKRRRGMMSSDMAQSILDEIGRSPLVKLVLFHLMGEPSLHPNLPEIAEYAQLRNVEVCITTNGSRFHEGLLRALLEANVGKIILSLQTPDAKSFAMRGAGGLSFEEYASRITAITRSFIENSKTHRTEMTVSFLSSPFRRLIVPLMEEFSIADTTSVLREQLRAWSERILRGTELEPRLPDVLHRIMRAGVFRENTLPITEKLSFQTRFVGDWGNHFRKKLIRARFGYCPGLQEHFGILWNGDYVYCCTDYDGKTSTANFNTCSVTDYLRSREVQQTVRGFQKFRVIHPHCRLCMGDSSYLKAFGKQMGSILYFKWLRKRPV